MQLQQVWQNVAQALTIFQGFELEEKRENKPTSNSSNDTNEDIKIQPLANEPKPNYREDKKEPLEKQKFIKYLETQKKQLEKQYLLPQIIDDSDDIGKLRTITEAFKTINNLEIDHLRLGKKKLPEHFVIKKNSVNLCIGFLQVGSSSFTTRIKNYNTLVVTHKDTKFILWRDSRQSAISGKVGKEEIAKLNNATNGDFLIMGQENRINFELLYKLIVDIQNRDLDILLETALEMTTNHFQNYWLIKSLM